MSRFGLHRTALASCLLLALLVPSEPTQAFMIRSFSLADLAREAHTVVIGQVVGYRSFYSDDHSVIYTHYTLEIERSLKGLAPALIEVRLMGGVVADRELVISGNPTLLNGERVLLFLRDSEDFYAVVGMYQGKWSVREHQGRDWVFRGPAPQESALQEGETPLDTLLQQCGLISEGSK